ncbi:12863_t:CDS:1, partial [Acaulospora morrowiae]
IQGTSTSIPNLKAKFWAFMENNQVSYIKSRVNRDTRRPLKGPHYTIDPNKMLTKCQCHNTGTHITVPTGEAMSLWTYSKNNQHYLANASKEIIEQLQARSEANTTPTVMINNTLSGKDTIQLNVNMVEDIKQLISNICSFPIIDLTTKDDLVFIENKEVNLALHS